MEPPLKRPQLSSKKLLEYFKSGDYGLRMILVYTWDGNVLYDEKSKQTFAFCNASRLWLRTSDSQMEINAADLLISLMRDLRRTRDDVAQLDSVFSRLTKARSCKAVWAETKQVLVNQDRLLALDASKDWLPIAHGKVINIHTLKRRDRIADDFFTRAFPCDVLPEDTPTPDIEEFALQLASGDRELATFLGQIMGGSNGKTSYQKLLAAILGPFYEAVSESIIISKAQDKNSNRPTAELLPLATARCISISETQPSSRLNAARIKAITGDGTPLKYRLPYGRKEETIIPIAKCFSDTNNVLIYDANEQAVKDRAAVIPFRARYCRNPQAGEYLADPAIVEALLTVHLDQVFTWALRCFSKLLAQGPKGFRNLPAVVRQESERFNRLQEPALCFVEDQLTVYTKEYLIDDEEEEDIDLHVPEHIIRHQFKRWSTMNGLACDDKKEVALLFQLLQDKDVATMERGKGTKKETLYAVKITKLT